MFRASSLTKLSPCNLSCSAWNLLSRLMRMRAVTGLEVMTTRDTKWCVFVKEKVHATT